MDWNILLIAMGIIYFAFFLVTLWGVGKAFKTNNKFFGFILILAAAAEVLAGYFIFGRYFIK